MSVIPRVDVRRAAPPRTHGLRRLLHEWAPSSVTAGAPAFPLLVLTGLNAVDELDRAAFAVLLPDIREHLGAEQRQRPGPATQAGMLVMVPASVAAGVILASAARFTTRVIDAVRTGGTRHDTS